MVAHTSPPPQSGKQLVAPLLLLTVGLLLIAAGAASSGREDLPGTLFVVTGFALLPLAAWMFGRPPPPAPITSPTAIALQAAAHLKELSFDGLVARGTIDGIDVEASVQDEMLTVQSTLPRALDLGLLLAREKEQRDPRSPIFVGNPAIDTAFCVLADEEERARAILSKPLCDHLSSGPDGLRVDDRHVTLWLYGPEPQQTSQAFQFVVDVAISIDEARPSVPCASLLASLRQSWEGSLENDWRITDTPLRIRGTVADIAVSARTARDAFEHYHFELRARFPRSLNLGMFLRPHSKNQELDREAEPIGYQRFDDTFEVSSLGVDAARLFQGEIRERLLELRELGLQIRGSDKQLSAWFGFNRNDPDAVPRILPELAAVASMLQERARELAAEIADPPHREL